MLIIRWLGNIGGSALDVYSCFRWELEATMDDKSMEEMFAAISLFILRKSV